MREPDSGRDLQLHQAVITRVISNFVEALTELVLAQQLRRVPIGVERGFGERFASVGMEEPSKETSRAPAF
jgi:hypothetical protein